MPFENDAVINGVIAMQLPTTMYQGVVDMLRNEGPLFIKFAQNRAFLGTGIETAGEGE